MARSLGVSLRGVSGPYKKGAHVCKLPGNMGPASLVVDGKAIQQ
jgi:hypothetical protein